MCRLRDTFARVIPLCDDLKIFIIDNTKVRAGHTPCVRICKCEPFSLKIERFDLGVF